MHKTTMQALGAGLLAIAAVQLPGAALATNKGSDRGVIAIIKPGETRALNFTKPGQRAFPTETIHPGAETRLPYIEQKHKTKHKTK